MNHRSFAHGRAAVWLSVFAIVCAAAWRDSARVVLDAWRHSEAAMCAGVPSFAPVAPALPRDGVVIFVGVEPAAAFDGQYDEFFRRFFCVQYALAPVVVRPAFAASLRTRRITRSADTFIVDARSDRAGILRELQALASWRGQTIDTQSLGADVVIASIVNPPLRLKGGEGAGEGADDR